MRAARNALAALLVLAASGASAQTWIERPYNPPVGSRWIVNSESTSEEVRSGGPRNTATKARSEFTIEDKTAAGGFKVVYVSRDVQIEGNTPGVAIMRQVVDVMKDITVRGTTDASGKPVRVDNLDEARTSMRKVVDRLVGMFKDKPQITQFIESFMGGLLIVDEKRAAATYLEYLPQLALGQNTGLKVGEVRRSVEEIPSPLGNGTLKTNLALQIVKADPATGKVSLLQTTTYDPVSIKEFSANAAKQLMIAADEKIPRAEFDEMMKKMSMTLDGRLEIEVEDGMTRRMVDTTITTASLMGITFNKREVKITTVTPAP
jgi:hypothetical protein